MHATSVSPAGKAWADAGFYTAASLGGWARIEANKHWPSDVLFSVAWGNFFAGFMYDWFFEDPENNRVRVSVSPTQDDGLMLNVNYLL